MNRRFYTCLLTLVTGIMTWSELVLAATSIPFTVNLSETVIVDTTGGTPRIAVDVGGLTRYATYISGSGTNALTFNYQLVSGDVDIDGVGLASPIQLNGGTIRDSAGNNATLTFTPPDTSNVKVNAAVPTGYTASFIDKTVTNLNKTNFGFTLNYNKANKTLHYSVSSSGGGTPLTGTVTTTGAVQNITGLDVSTLPDGKLTLSAYLTDSIGGTGTTVTDTAPMAVLDSSLVGHWTFDANDISGTTAYDRSGQNNNGTLTNGPTQTTGQVGGALNFDGVDDTVTLSTSPSISLEGRSQATLVAWINAPVTPGVSISIIGQTTSASGRCKLCLYFQPSLKFDLTGRDQTVDPVGGLMFFVSGNTSITLNQWTLAVGVYDSDIDQFSIYLNGNIDSSISTPKVQLGGSIPLSTGIGYLQGAAAAQHYSGYIDNVRIYNRSLTPTEITTLYNAER